MRRNGVTGQRPRVTAAILREAQANAERRFGPDVSVQVTPEGAGVGWHHECVIGPTTVRANGKRQYWCSACHDNHPIRRWRDAYAVTRPMGSMGGAMVLVLGKGFSFGEAFAQAEAHQAEKTARTAKSAVVPLPAARKAARLPQAQRSSSRTTTSIPLASPVTGPRVCRDCGVGLETRTRCNRCALRHWRTTHSDEKHTQDARYRAQHPNHVRALVRARVAQWRKRQTKT